MYTLAKARVAMGVRYRLMNRSFSHAFMVRHAYCRMRLDSLPAHRVNKTTNNARHGLTP